MKKNVGILIFDEVEILDFAGPFEVFGVCSNLHENALFDVFTVAKTTKSVAARNSLMIDPTYSFDQHPSIDLLIIPGGYVVRKLIEDKDTLKWVSSVQKRTEIMLSVCTGSIILGKLGLLDHRPYCTHQDGYELMKQLVPSGQPKKSLRFTESEPGRIYTSGGISAGLDLSFHIVERLHGRDAVISTAKEMEYSPNDYDYNKWGSS